MDIFYGLPSHREMIGIESAYQTYPINVGCNDLEVHAGLCLRPQEGDFHFDSSYNGLLKKHFNQNSLDSMPYPPKNGADCDERRPILFNRLFIKQPAVTFDTILAFKRRYGIRRGIYHQKLFLFDAGFWIQNAFLIFYRANLEDYAA